MQTPSPTRIGSTRATVYRDSVTTSAGHPILVGANGDGAKLVEVPLPYDKVPTEVVAAVHMLCSVIQHHV